MTGVLDRNTQFGHSKLQKSERRTASRTRSAATMDPSRLQKDELKHELLYRGVTTMTSTEAMRRTLRKLLRLKSDRMADTVQPSLSRITDPVDELDTVEAKLVEVDPLIQPRQDQSGHSETTVPLN